VVRRDRGAATPLVPIASVKLPGRHLLADVLAAAAVGCVAGVPPAAMQRAVENFAGLEHALERAGEIDGVQFVNDSKATNIASARKALESFGTGLVVILGGRFKSGDFSLLRDPLRARDAKVVAIGEATSMIERALDGAVPVEAVETLEAAVRRAYELARAQGSGGVVLLAPACASFDMFRDYAERGRAFKKEVLRLNARER